MQEILGVGEGIKRILIIVESFEMSHQAKKESGIRHFSRYTGINKNNLYLKGRLNKTMDKTISILYKIIISGTGS